MNFNLRGAGDRGIFLGAGRVIKSGRSGSVLSHGKRQQDQLEKLCRVCVGGGQVLSVVAFLLHFAAP